MNRVLATVGVVLTIAYIGILLVISAVRSTEIFTMPLNNLGDFLAGGFGPLAILWLILGFFQQGIELRQNTEALRLQAEELRQSVEHQRQLVEVSRAQVAAEIESVRYERDRLAKAAKPNFVFMGVGASYDGTVARYSTNVKNMGNHAIDVSLSFNPAMK